MPNLKSVLNPPPPHKWSETIRKDNCGRESIPEKRVENVQGAAKVNEIELNISSDLFVFVFYFFNLFILFYFIFFWLLR